MKNLLTLALLAAALFTCATGQGADAPPRPNILWITCEDISPNLGCYGDQFYYYVSQLQAVRSGPWKLYLPDEKSRAQSGGTTAKAPGRLYHLTDDPGEQNDQFARQPDIVKRLLAHAEAARADLGEGNRPGKGVRPVGKMENPTPRLLKP